MTVNKINNYTNTDRCRLVSGHIKNFTEINAFVSPGRGRLRARDGWCHLFRYGFVANWCRKNEQIKKLLDVGCGKNAPLLQVLWINDTKLDHYVGIDYHKVSDEVSAMHSAVKQMEFYDGDVSQKNALDKFENFDAIVCFEVLEHQTRNEGRQLLDNLVSIIGDATLFISTPVFHEQIGQARNHIYEWEFDELKSELLRRFSIIESFGTFVSVKQLDKIFADNIWYKRARQYYFQAIIGVMLAPTVPAEEASNVVWMLKRKQD